ncbi:hypothetical protein ACTFIV_006714 [Dictyostelium citrinum]
MKVHSIGFFKVESSNRPILLNIFYELSSIGFFQRGQLKELSLFLSRETIKNIKVGERVSMVYTQSQIVCHSIVDSKGLGCCIITDLEYPCNIAHSLIEIYVKEFDKAHPEPEWNSEESLFTIPTIDQLLLKYQNPETIEPKGEYIIIEKKQQIGEDITSCQGDIKNFQSEAFMNNNQRMMKCCGYI